MIQISNEWEAPPLLAGAIDSADPTGSKGEVGDVVEVHAVEVVAGGVFWPIVDFAWEFHGAVDLENDRIEANGVDSAHEVESLVGNDESASLLELDKGGIHQSCVCV